MEKNIDSSPTNKQKCDCGKLAVWLYCPAREHDHPFYCDDCVIEKDVIPCSCEWRTVDGEHAEQPEGVEGIDWKWIDVEKAKLIGYDVEIEEWWYQLQPNGKPWPCCEYNKYEEGFEIEQN